MGISFNAEDVFQMGVFIEENGQKFYQTLADKVTEPRAKEVLQNLSRWEEQHRQLFLSLKEKLPAEAKAGDVWDPDEEGLQYLKAAADTHVFNMNKDLDAFVANVSTPEDAIHLALQFEKDSVILFLGMKETTPESFGKSEIDRIIKEEQSHLRYLHAYLKKV